MAAGLRQPARRAADRSRLVAAEQRSGRRHQGPLVKIGPDTPKSDAAEVLDRLEIG